MSRANHHAFIVKPSAIGLDCVMYMYARMSQIGRYTTGSAYIYCNVWVLFNIFKQRWRRILALVTLYQCVAVAQVTSRQYVHIQVYL